MPIFKTLLPIRQSAIAKSAMLNSAALRRPASIVRNRRRVANRRHANTRVIDRSNRRFASTARTLARARIGVRALATNWQPTTMAQPPICADIHQALNVHLNALAKIAFNLALSFDD